MPSDSAPLLVALELTPEQRALIREKTGLQLAVLPFESDADAVRCQFGGVTLRVTRGVFTPATATEGMLELVREAAAAHRRPVVVDVGTGSGAVALAVAAALPHADVVAIDTSEAALACARRNRDRLRLRNVAIRRGSLLSPVPNRYRGRVAVIAGNLPYIPPKFSEAALRTFPVGTVLGRGWDGLDLQRQLAAAARDLLVPGGSLVLQMADFQWDPFSAELRNLGYEEPVFRDRQPKRPVAGRMRWPGCQPTGSK